MLTLHEQIISPLRGLLGTGGFFYYAWIIPAIVFLILFLIVYTKFLISLPTHIRIKFITAGLIYVIGAVGLEAIGGKIFTSYGANTLFYSLLTTVEEVLEIIGILLFIYVLLQYYQLIFSSFIISVMNDETEQGNTP
jgi:hypothetical protein